MVVDEDVSCGSLINEIRKACKQVGDAELFDIYRGEQLGKGKKSMAFKITFVPEDKALDPKDIERFVKKILGNLKLRAVQSVLEECHEGPGTLVGRDHEQQAVHTIEDPAVAGQDVA